MTPRNIFNKGIQDLYTESHTTLLRKIEDDLNKWRDMSSSWIMTQYC